MEHIYSKFITFLSFLFIAGVNCTFAGNAVKVKQQLQLLAKKAEPEAAPEEQPAP